jgi:hypothetical protein
MYWLVRSDAWVSRIAANATALTPWPVRLWSRTAQQSGEASRSKSG